MIKDGRRVDGFIDPFYRGEGVAFPPTVYPQDWYTDRAARIGIGMKAGKLVVIWAEGSKVQVYDAQTDSLGFSLDEFAHAAEGLGLEQCVNLDGGGSSQMAVGNVRYLRIADRYLEDGRDFERPVPVGLSITIVPDG